MVKNKIRLIMATFIVTLMTSSVAMAWGPEDRATFTMENPADYVTFNSITDNNILGDERNFVRVVEADTGNAYSDEVKIEPGKEYEVYIFYHNNAKSSLNASGVGIAKDVVVSSAFPGYVNSSEKKAVSAVITSPYANPTQVWDEAYFTTDSDVDVVLKYVDASAKIYNAGKVNGSVLSESLFDSGVFIGINSLDGRIPGCTEYSGHIIYRLRAEQVGAKVTKTVSTNSAQPGDEVEFKVEFTNTGTTILQDVTFHDEFSEGLTLVPGTTHISDSLGYEEDLTDLISLNGYNIGSVGKGVTITLTYKAKIAENLYDNGCYHKLSNKIYVDHQDGEVYDSTEIEVVKDGCDEKPTDPDNPDDPDDPDDPNNPDKENCKTNPEMEGCDELPNTGPVEIVMAIVVALGIGGGGYYLYRTKRNLKTVVKSVSGPTDNNGGSQKPDNMVK